MANNGSQTELQDICQNARSLGFSPERLMHLDKMISNWVIDRKVCQAVILKVMRHGQNAFEVAYGQNGLNEELGPVGMDTIFPLCSITKPITATLICQLQEDGLLELNQRVRPHLNGLKGDENSNIRIWQLLSHSSGYIDDDIWQFADNYGPDVMGLTKPEEGAPTEEWDTYFQAIRKHLELPEMEPGEEMHWDTIKVLRMMAPPTYPPHTNMSYCNNGYQYLADIVRKITGRPLEEYAREKIFDPLKMNDTYFHIPEEKMNRFFRRGERFDGWEWLNDGILNSESGAGGIKSTAEDICRFTAMFLNGGSLDGARILSKATIKMMLTDHNVGLPSSLWEGQTYESYWGLGWNVHKDKIDDAGMVRSPRAFDHSGFGGSKIFGDPEHDVALAFFYTQPSQVPDWNWGMAHINNMVLGTINN